MLSLPVIAALFTYHWSSDEKITWWTIWIYNGERYYIAEELYICFLSWGLVFFTLCKSSGRRVCSLAFAISRRLVQAIYYYISSYIFRYFAVKKFGFHLK